VEDIETKIDTLLDMYKEDRNPVKPITPPAVKLDDVMEHGALRTAAESEPSSPRVSASELTSSRQHRVKPMLRHWSDLGPRAKKRVTYSAHDTLPAVTLDYKRPSHMAVGLLAQQQQPSTVSEEEEEISVRQQLLHSVAVDTDVNSQSVQRHTCTSVDVSPHVTPAQQSDFDTNTQLYTLPTYQLASCNNSPD